MYMYMNEYLESPKDGSYGVYIGIDIRNTVTEIGPVLDVFEHRANAANQI